MTLRTVRASRYVLPFREGGSVPALVEADDLGLYVVKLRGAGQGPRALVAEWICGELARAAGLAVPDIVLVDLDRAIADSEPDPELSEPLEKSAGINLGLDYLPGSISFDPAVGPRPDSELASRIVLFDGLVANVDRTAKNSNLLTWHRRLWLIDHGAALYFHHAGRAADWVSSSGDPFGLFATHVLLPAAKSLPRGADHLRSALRQEVIEAVVAQLPSSWLDDAEAERAAYVAWLTARMEHLGSMVEEAERARV